MDRRESDTMIPQYQKFFLLGFFPEELPPEFGPYGFTEGVCEEIWEDINQVSPAVRSNVFHATRMSFPKSKLVRREFHYINPLSFARLSYTLLNNWDDIFDHTDSSSFSTSRLEFDESDNKIFKKDPFYKSINERINRSVSKNHVLYIDIENFYRSIYTHSIDWALNEGNKRHYSEFNNRDHLGVAIDQDVRRGQDNVTNGIAVGPITSRVISEIITCHFDVELQEAFGDLKGVRHFDDYHLYLNSMKEVGEVQTFFQKLLSNFRLKLNEAKIRSEELPEVFSKYWTQYFQKEFYVNDSGHGNKKALTSAFSKAFELLKEDKNHPSLRYLFSLLENDDILGKFELSYLMEMVHHSIKVDPRSISRACRALSKNELIDEDLHDYIIHFKPTMIRFSELGYTFELLWMLYLFLHSKRSVPDKVVDNVIKNCDKTCLLYLFLCADHGLVSDDRIQSAKQLVKKRAAIYEDIWSSPFWLLAYEDKRHEWGIFEKDIPESFEVFIENDIAFLLDEPNKDYSDIHINRYESTFEDNEEMPF